MFEIKIFIALLLPGIGAMLLKEYRLLRQNNVNITISRLFNLSTPLNRSFSKLDLVNKIFFFIQILFVTLALLYSAIFKIDKAIYALIIIGGMFLVFFLLRKNKLVNDLFNKIKK